MPRSEGGPRFLALKCMTCNKRAPALFESATKAGTRRAAGMTALLLDVLLELENGCGLFGDELLDRRVPCRHRQRGIDRGDFALDMGDDPLLGCGQQCGELRADGAPAIRSFGAMGAAQQAALGHLNAANGFRRREDDQFGGFPFFRGLLAQPFQGSRYWSLSQPLPRSRSFQ